MADSSVLIDLAAGDLLKELFQLGRAVLIPDLVLGELDWPSDTALLALGASAVSLSGRQME